MKNDVLDVSNPNTGELQYLELLGEMREGIISEGFPNKDRTGVGTYSVFGRQIRFNLQEGFPLFTHKQVFMRGIFEELLWFMSGSTNERDLCFRTKGVRDDGVGTIWSPNCLDKANRNPERFNGHNMGNMYNMAWRKLPCSPHGLDWIKTPDFIDDYKEVFTKPVMDKVYQVQKVRMSNTCGEFKTLGKIGGKFVVQFLDTGSYKAVNTICKSIKDDYKPSVCGVGYTAGQSRDNPTHKALYRVWQDMLIRCYTPRKHHNHYDDVVVCKRWHSFKNFVYDAYFLHGFQEFVDSGYSNQLDKDYYGARIYSPDTCIFVSGWLNKTLNRGSKLDFKVYEYEGKFYYSRTVLEEVEGISRKKPLPTSVVVHESVGGVHPRPKIWIDQFAGAIKLIKEDAASRRIVMDSWNPRNDGNAALSICHPMVQFFVKNGKLSCQLYQRSADLLLGVPFNIASYALLTHLIALECGLDVGEFVWVGGDIHVYSNQMEGLNEILDNRFALNQPKIKINKVDSIYNYQWSDIEILDYNHLGKVEMPVAV